MGVNMVSKFTGVLRIFEDTVMSKICGTKHRILSEVEENYITSFIIR
jgi:hypothetical protein